MDKKTFIKKVACAALFSLIATNSSCMRYRQTSEENKSKLSRLLKGCIENF